ncbi:MAG: HypC/HybG/HupF family hydrogenase formation chaperone [Actinomycetota bacterium]|nr:HypC/HybG/HupF family hydrogenase formation chaperone [Actinomycetota bacterium]
MSYTPAEPVCGSDHCITCADEGVPMTVCAVDEGRGLALCVDGQESSSTVEIALVAPVARGQRLLVHAGTAIAMLNDQNTEEEL